MPYTGTTPQWLAWGELLFGVVYFILGLRSRPYRYPDGRPIDFRPKTLAPIGLCFILAAASRFARGFVSDVVLFSIGGVALAGVVVWAVRLNRAKTRDLARIVQH